MRVLLVSDGFDLATVHAKMSSWNSRSAVSSLFAALKEDAVEFAAIWRATQALGI